MNGVAVMALLGVFLLWAAVSSKREAIKTGRDPHDVERLFLYILGTFALVCALSGHGCDS